MRNIMNGFLIILIYNLNISYYHGNVINIHMNEWYKDNCEKGY